MNCRGLGFADFGGQTKGPVHVGPDGRVGPDREPMTGQGGSFQGPGNDFGQSHGVSGIVLLL